MQKIARKYNSEEVKSVVSLSMRRDKRGDLFYMVEYSGKNGQEYSCFEFMSSAIDFINSNFKKYE